MKTIFALPRQMRLRTFAVAVAMAAAAITANAQAPAARIRFEISSAQMSLLKGSQHPLALPQNDAGPMPGDTPLHGITLYFNRSAAQEADLQALLAAQQNPASPQYHRWLTPDQFGARFGVADFDIAKVSAWLEQQGFAIDSVSRSRNAIRFSGAAAQVEQAFQTQMRYFNADGARHFAPSTPLSVPAAIAPVVAGIRNLNDFRPRPTHIAARTGFTSSQSGNVFFAPGDILTAYDALGLVNSGFNGQGQTIAALGQSQIAISDIENFQSAAGLTKKDPTLVMVPGSGVSTVYTGDESESDLDLEWSSAIAPGANIVLVYTGNNTNYGVYDSMAFAIDENLANILSLSYSSCELGLTQSDVTSLESVLAQAASQGQTVLAASGDQGSTACSGETGLTTAQQQTIAVNYPASSAYVLGLGGTEIPASDIFGGSNFSTYWISSSSSDVTNSLKQYIPEIVWNDDALSAQSGSGLSATGGGASIYVARPSWQAGVTGIPSGSHRLVPDVALYSSPSYPGYLYCSSDTSVWFPGSTTSPAQQASCNSGFRDGTSGGSYLTLAGGTSFATPIFAGFVAILNQKLDYPTGQGPINSTLYSLAANSSTYASAFHDVTSGNNNCSGGSTLCGSTTGGFSAGTGYDEVTGLGSVDLANLAAVWPANTGSSATLTGTSTTVSASNSAPTLNANVTFTITVSANSGTGTPSGAVNLSIDGAGTAYGASGSALIPVTLLANGTATYTTAFTTAGPHEVVALYAGAGSFAVSTGSTLVTVPVTSSGKGTFALAATPSTLTVARGTSGTETITATPAGGYTGNVLLTVDFGTSGDNALQNLCGGFGNGVTAQGTIGISGTAAASTTLFLDTNASDCITTAGMAGTGLRPLKMLIKNKTGAANHSMPVGSLPAGLALAGFALMGFLGRRSRRLRNLAAVLILAAAGLAISACGSSTINNKVANPPKGTYTGTVTGQDSTTAAITGSTTFTFVIN